MLAADGLLHEYKPGESGAGGSAIGVLDPTRSPSAQALPICCFHSFIYSVQVESGAPGTTVFSLVSVLLVFQD